MPAPDPSCLRRLLRPSKASRPPSPSRHLGEGGWLLARRRRERRSPATGRRKEGDGHAPAPPRDDASGAEASPPPPPPPRSSLPPPLLILILFRRGRSPHRPRDGRCGSGCGEGAGGDGGADWKTAANILFTVPPKRKEFGLDFHLVQLFFVCMPSLAVYLVAMYARREIKRMEAEAEEKRKKKEELEKQKQLEADSVKEDADSKLATVLVRLDALEGVVKEIADDKTRRSVPDLSTKKEALKRVEASSPDNASASKSNASDSQLASVKAMDVEGATNAPPNVTQQDSKGGSDKAIGESRS